MSIYGTKEIEKFAEIFKALSNPNRLSIFLYHISCCEPGTFCATDSKLVSCCSAVVNDLGLAPSTVSHHLKELRRAGLIQTEKQGKKIVCSIDPAVLKELSDFFTHKLPNNQ